MIYLKNMYLPQNLNSSLEAKNRLHGGFIHPRDQGRRKNQAGHYNAPTMGQRNSFH